MVNVCPHLTPGKVLPLRLRRPHLLQQQLRRHVGLLLLSLLLSLILSLLLSLLYLSPPYLRLLLLYLHIHHHLLLSPPGG